MRALRYLMILSIFISTILGCKDDKAKSTDPFRAVPSNASLIININDFGRAQGDFQGTRIQSVLDSVTPLTELKNSVLQLEELLNSEQLSQFLENRSLLLSVAISGANKFNLLLITHGDPSFEQFLGQRLSQDYQVEKREYSGAEIYRFYEENSDKEFYLSSYQNLILFSKSSTLIEEAVRQVNTDYSLKDDPVFYKLYKSSNKKDPANIFVNFKEATPMFQRLLPRAELDFMPKMGEWMEMDLRMFKTEMLMSGISILPPNGDSYLNVFEVCDAGESKGIEIVPDGFGAWIALNFDNAEQYYRSYEKYLEHNGRLRKHQQLLDKLESNGKEHLLNWVDNEVGLILLPGKGGTYTEVAYLTARDKDLAEELLDTIADGEFIEGYRGLIIKKVKLENALPRVYGSLFEQFHHPYFFMYKNYAVFSGSLSGLKGMINDILDDKTLAKSSSYEAFNSRLPDQSNLRVVVGNPSALQLLGGVIDENSVKDFNSYKDKLTDFQYATMQWKVEDKVAYANFFLQSTTKEIEKVSRVWSTSLEATIVGEPQFVLNHNSRRYDILVQDEKNKLYLLDRQGKILWSRELDGPIMGSVQQLDAFKNRKLQMLFNTAKSVYMLDRLGRDVENFPVQLKASCTAPVAVIDYDKNRTYRILVPQGEVLSNLNVQGKKVKGWAFKKAPGDIVSMPQHFSVGGKDVIVAQCSNGTLLQLNRRGEQRFNKIKDLPQFKHDFYMVKAGTLSESELIAVGDDGMLYSIKPGGSTDKVYLDQDYPADDMLYFEERYIFSSDDQLFIKDEKQPWHAEFEGDITQAPKAMILRGKFYVAAFSNRGEEIRLFNNEGELISGFPVFAQGGFDMGSLNVDGGINIVTSSNDGTLICYRVN